MGARVKDLTGILDDLDGKGEDVFVVDDDDAEDVVDDDDDDGNVPPQTLRSLRRVKGSLFGAKFKKLTAIREEEEVAFVDDDDDDNVDENDGEVVDDDDDDSNFPPDIQELAPGQGFLVSVQSSRI